MSNADAEQWKRRYMEAKEQVEQLLRQDNMRLERLARDAADKLGKPVDFQFVYWLRGYVELCGDRPTEDQWFVIKEHLDKVFPTIAMC